MELVRISEQIKSSKNHAIYYKLFLKAATEQQFLGVIELGDVLRLSPAKKGGKPRDVADYAVLPTPEFLAWHDQAITSTKTRSTAPSYADLVAGRVDLQHAAERTAQQLQKRRERSTLTAQRARERRAHQITPE